MKACENVKLANLLSFHEHCFGDLFMLKMKAKNPFSIDIFSMNAINVRPSK